MYIIYHKYWAAYNYSNTNHIVQVPNMKEVILIGYYQQNEPLSRFIASVQREFNIPVR